VTVGVGVTAGGVAVKVGVLVPGKRVGVPVAVDVAGGVVLAVGVGV
jgi:hypothetical protein